MPQTDILICSVMSFCSESVFIWQELNGHVSEALESAGRALARSGKA